MYFYGKNREFLSQFDEVFFGKNREFLTQFDEVFFGKDREYFSAQYIFEKIMNFLLIFSKYFSQKSWIFPSIFGKILNFSQFHEQFF